MSYRRVVTSIDINKINEEFVDVTKREISEKWGETKVRTRHETSFVLARVNPPYSGVLGAVDAESVIRFARRLGDVSRKFRI